MKEIYIISELCGQFGGNMRKAEQMILQSKMAGANAIKVQLYDTYRMPGENRELWEYLSIKENQFEWMKDFSDKLNIAFFASAFHEDRFQWIQKQNLSMNKIASSLLINDFDICQKMVGCNIFTLCSLGKWNKDNYPFDNNNVFYLHCVCEYPHTFERAMSLMPPKFDDRLIGYSDHSIGIEACKEAVKRGATYIEKHFTLNHNLQSKTEGAHICSMNLQQLTELRTFCDEYTK